MTAMPSGVQVELWEGSVLLAVDDDQNGTAAPCVMTADEAGALAAELSRLAEQVRTATSARTPSPERPTAIKRRTPDTLACD